MTNLTDRVEAFRFKNRNDEIIELYHKNLVGKRTYTIVDKDTGNEEEFSGDIFYIEGYQRISGRNSFGRFESPYSEDGKDKHHSASKRELGVEIRLVNAGREKKNLRGVVHKDRGYLYREHLIIDLLDVVRIE